MVESSIVNEGELYQFYNRRITFVVNNLAHLNFVFIKN